MHNVTQGTACVHKQTNTTEDTEHTASICVVSLAATWLDVCIEMCFKSLYAISFLQPFNKPVKLQE